MSHTAIASHLPISSRVAAGPWAAKFLEPSNGDVIEAIPRAPRPADLTNDQLRPTTTKVGQHGTNNFRSVSDIRAAAGNTFFTITGTQLTGGGVTFNGNPATNVTVNGAGTSLTGRTPAGTPGNATVTVTTPSGSDNAPTGYTYTTVPAFAVLAGTTVTNTGPSVVTGDIGVSPGTSITGFPPGTVIGGLHSADAVAVQAQTDLTAAYNSAAGQTPDSSIAGDLGGLTMTPGVYNAAAAITLTGTLTLDAQGNPNASWVFQIGSTLTTAAASSVLLVNGAVPRNVFWQIGSSATLGTNSVFAGSILALTSITATTGASIDGQALARNGAVTMDTNTITKLP